MTSNSKLEGEVTSTSLLSGVSTTGLLLGSFTALPRLVKYCSSVLWPPVELASSPGGKQGGSGNTAAGSSSSDGRLSWSPQMQPICHRGAGAKMLTGSAITLVSTGLYIRTRGTVWCDYNSRKLRLPGSSCSLTSSLGFRATHGLLALFFLIEILHIFAPI